MTDICKSPDRLRQTVTCPGFVYVYAADGSGEQDFIYGEAVA